jgi:protein-L-isoaspartate(D-aspartate) O-methyltransferase
MQDASSSHDAQKAPNLPATDESAQPRAALVASLVARGLLVTPSVIIAMNEVPRHLFVPGVSLTSAYADDAIVTKWEGTQPVSSSSQPAMVAIMLEQLAVGKGMRVLEIGAGTGYNAALLAAICGPDGHVTTIDLDEDTAVAAHTHLQAAGCGPDRVTVICGDGALGWPDAAPYDRIIVTAGTWDVLPAWLEQLAPGGRIVLPIAIRTVQASLACDKREDSSLHIVSWHLCGFMRLRGAFAGPEVTLSLPGESGQMLIAEPPIPPKERLAALLSKTPRQRALRASHSAELIARVIAVAGPNVYSQFSHASHPLLRQHATGIITPEGDSACFVTGHTGLVVEYGAATATQQLNERIARWQACGSPPLASWGGDIIPHAVLPELPSPCRHAIRKQHTTLIVSWDSG